MSRPRPLRGFLRETGRETDGDERGALRVLHEDLDPTSKVTVGYHPIGAWVEMLRTLD